MTVDASLSTALGLGFLLGLRHALDADHIAAVSALVSQHRGVGRSCLLGMFWGAGHTIALLGAAVAMMAFRFRIAPEVQRGLEAIVAVVLVILGVHVLLRSARDFALHGHPHSHGGPPHSHPHLHLAGEHEHAHMHLARLGRRPFAVGLLHGLAGSAAVTLLVMTTIPSALGGVLYIALFGVGSIVGMLLISGLLGIPFSLAADRSRALGAGIQLLAGLLSAGLGVALLAGLA